LPKVGIPFSGGLHEKDNKVLHADDEKFNVIPDSVNLNAQYLQLYEMSGDLTTLEGRGLQNKKSQSCLSAESDDSKTLRTRLP
jgi:hypothetical protein